MITSGIYPDYMHKVDLALAMDSMSSILLDLTDDGMNLIAGASRDRRLNEVWFSYRDWCEQSGQLSCSKNTLWC